MPRHRNEVVVIMWRDIPAQVNGQSGRQRHQVVLDPKFQRAIDRAKRKARIVTAQEDVADRLDAEYSEQRLGKIAFNGGVE